MNASRKSDRTVPGDGDRQTMGIDPFERNWMKVSALLLVCFFATVTIAGFAMGFEVPGADQEVDPATFTDREPWASPGLREIEPGVYEAYVIAQTWSFAPRELVVPVGSEVTIYVSSPDLQHGFKITDTNINMQVVPGQVSKLTWEADEIGEFPYICTEYCGKGHAAMYGTIKVVSETDADASSAAGESAAAGPVGTDEAGDGAEEEQQ